MADQDPIVAEINALPPDLEDAENALRDLLARHKAKELRKTCTLLHLTPQRRDAQNSKVGYIHLLWDYYNAKRDGVAVSENGDPPVTKHCRFRLLNVIFSDEFVDRIGEAASGENSPYWVRITRAFNEDAEKYNNFPLGEGKPLYRSINTKLAVKHCSNKLRATWEKSLTRYERAMELTKQPSSQEQFWEYCSGNIDALYVSDWLKFHSDRRRIVTGLVPLRAIASNAADQSLASSDGDRPAKRPRRMNTVERIPEVLDKDRDDELVRHGEENTEEIKRWNIVERSSAAVKAASATLNTLKAHCGEGIQLEAAEHAVKKLIARWIQTMEDAS